MTTFILICLWIILIYYIALHGIYLLLILIGSFQVHKYRRGVTFDEFQRIAESDLSMPVSVIIPAHNEELIIVNTTENSLKLNYPNHQVIVVDDGSTDRTMQVLIEHFGLRRVDKQGPRQLTTKKILGIYESETHPNLVVVAKENGRRPDAINAAIAISQFPLICVIDADCVMEPDALLQMARPFLRDSHVTAVAGVVRPSNGLLVSNGDIKQRGLPGTLLGMTQEVEYTRSFQWARIGLSRLQSMLCISGALMLVKKDVFVSLGGSWPAAITDDIEFTIRLNRHIFDRKERKGGAPHQRLVFAPDAVCYTEVPETFRLYGSQRNRWQRGTIEALLRNWPMILNPRYGMTGLFGMPFFILFEASAAFIELATYILIFVTMFMGVATLWEILLMFYVGYVLGVFLSLSAILLTETSRLRASSWRDLWRMLAAVFVENLGFHQFHLLARVIGSIQFLLYHRRDLGIPMERLTPKIQTT